MVVQRLHRGQQTLVKNLLPQTTVMNWEPPTLTKTKHKTKLQRPPAGCLCWIFWERYITLIAPESVMLRKLFPARGLRWNLWPLVVRYSGSEIYDVLAMWTSTWRYQEVPLIIQVSKYYGVLFQCSTSAFASIYLFLFIDPPRGNTSSAFNTLYVCD